jgi:hypothetical protein
MQTVEPARLQVDPKLPVFQLHCQVGLVLQKEIPHLLAGTR